MDGGPLNDWSMAGYRSGQLLPDVAVGSDLKVDWGAVGDGTTDDTQARSAYHCFVGPFTSVMRVLQSRYTLTI